MTFALSRPRIATGTLVLGLALLTGCMHPGTYDPARMGPLYTPTNHSGDADLGGIRRVVVMPVWTGQNAPVETAAELDPVISKALQASMRFEVVILSREECLRRYRAEAFSSASELPLNLMETLKRDYAADAVLFVDVTVFRPYRPLALGLRAKLTSTAESRLVWIFDNLFSAEDATVANAARNHFLDADKRVPADTTHGVLHSPSRFAAYASTEMFATLPPVAAKAPVRSAAVTP